MGTSPKDFPAWPPGLWRRIVLQPGRDGHSRWIGGALEDDMHRFHMRFDHADGRIVAVKAEALRHPWSACPGAAPHIAGELPGALLTEVAARDPALHCTHLYDLAVVMAAHAGDAKPTRFDMRVADRVDDRTTAVLERNGVERMRWQLDSTAIAGGTFAGRDLRQLSKWKRELPAEEAELATILRRAVFVSGGRQFMPVSDRASDQGSFRAGVCFNYQPEQAAHSVRRKDWRTDFSESGVEPLGTFDPANAFAAMA